MLLAVLLLHTLPHAAHALMESALAAFVPEPRVGQPYNFTSGGDVGNTHEASYITSAAAAMEPLFASEGDSKRPARHATARTIFLGPATAILARTFGHL